ncbi:site-specific DNA-methyltransferase [Mycoplasma sp. 613B]
MNLLEKYKKEIEEISSKELNQDQKDLAIKILEKFNDNELEYVFQFIAQRVKTGFRFDVAPENDSQTIALLQKNEKLSFVLDKNKSKENTLIIGENYDALKNLLVIERERERAGLEYNYDLIYIDPPYNTEATKEDGNSVANDKENINANKFVYRDKYSRNGWLNFMNERLRLAKKLLKDDGVIFVSIDDGQQAYLKVLMDEIFGEENFVANLNWVKKHGPGGNTSFNYSIVKNTEYILTYANDINIKQFNYKKHNEEEFEKLGYVNKDEFFEERGYYKLTDLHHPSSTGSFQYIKSLDYLITAPDGTEFSLYNNIIKPESARYTWGYETYLKGRELGFIECVKNSEGYWIAKRKQYQYVKFNPKTKEIIKLEAGQPYENIIDDFYSSEGGSDMKNILSDKNSFDFPKPSNLIKFIINLASERKNIRVLDFFAGSGTTGHAVLELNREDGGNRTYTLVTNNQNNIAIEVNYERLYRINTGKGTKGETFDWLKNNNPYNSNLNVFDIKYIDASPFSNIEIKEIIKELIKVLKEFGINNLNIDNLGDTKELLNSLLSLKPQVKEENGTN